MAITDRPLTFIFVRIGSINMKFHLKNVVSPILITLFLSAILTLSGCGGGGGGSSAPATYSISGTVILSDAAQSGVTITLTGGTTTTTDASGNYRFTGLANGNYTVTPSKTGYAFSPVSLAVSVSGADVTGKNFAATVAATTYSVSGTVSGATGVTINLSGTNTGSVVTGAGGAYTLSGLVAGSYTVTPSLPGYTFTPTNKAVTIVDANSTANDFVATAIPVAHSLSGTVSGATAAGVTITVTGTANATATTGADGTYTVPGLFDGSYTVTPTKAGYTFSPNSTAVTMSGADVTGKNFTATANPAPTYTLSGAVTGAWVEGVTITMSGAGNGTTTTNASGQYSFANLPAGSYTLTPSLAGYTYAPSAPTIAVSANTTQNFVATSAIPSYSISGTVSYAGSKTGGIAIRVYQSNCNGCGPAGGTAIAAPGAYTVRGLQNGSYVVVAEKDALGTGNANATNPIGSSGTATIASANLPGVNVSITDPALPAPVKPILKHVFPGNGSAFVAYSPPMDINGQEIATSYKVYWGTDAGATNGIGSPKTFIANGDNSDVYVLSGLTDGAALYFKMTALVGSTESALTAVVGPVTIGAVAGANTVSGTVTFPGTATGPMMVGVHSKGGVYFTTIASPASPQSYSISGVPSGSYQLFAVIDMNNNGIIDSGDINNANDTAPTITVSGNTTSNLTLTSASAIVRANTDHRFDGATNTYSLIPNIYDGTKHAVAVTLISGLNVAVPFDMGIDPSNSTWISLNANRPTGGDTYMFKVTYSDGTTQTLSGSVTGVLDTFATSLSVTATPSATIPTFSWAAPATPPAFYTYRLDLWGNSDSTNWNYPNGDDLPSTTLSALYNTDGGASSPSLTSGNAYTWRIQVRDAFGNSATRQTIYTVP